MVKGNMCCLVVVVVRPVSLMQVLLSLLLPRVPFISFGLRALAWSVQVVFPIVVHLHQCPARFADRFYRKHLHHLLCTRSETYLNAGSGNRVYHRHIFKYSVVGRVARASCVHVTWLSNFPFVVVSMGHAHSSWDSGLAVFN